MAVSVPEFVDRYPVLWHITCEANLQRIRRTRALESAAALMQQAGDDTWLRRRRREPQRLNVDGESIWLRDQEPLMEGAIRFEGSWNLERLIEEINKRVFFWPGDFRGPISRARENFDAFRNQPGAVALRLPSDAVAACCRPFHLQLTVVNVGAPRVSGGKKSLRGPRTFMAMGALTGTLSDVREVAVVDRLSLDAVWPMLGVDNSL
jgi:uncharacterized protein DUF7002